MSKTYERKTSYGRDNRDRHGQGLLPWGPGKSISTMQAAAIMKCSHDMIARMCETGELEAYRLRSRPRSPWRVITSSLEKHIGRVLDEYGR